ncbi:MAG: nucleoside hydrolase [Microbacterium sp.]
MHPHPVIIDCDPGHDDAIALMLAVRHLDLVAVTTVGGNAPLEEVTRNALNILEVLERDDVPVHAGHDRPILGELTTAPQFHGASGLDGPELGMPAASAEDEHAVDAIVRIVRGAEPRGATLLATGPLTNVAAALRRDPEIVRHLADIVIMGGSATVGNWTPAAEFNIVVDPEAAAVVFRSGVPVRMAGINLTRQCTYGAGRRDDLAAIGTRAAKLTTELIDHFMGTTHRAIGLREATLHDACAAAWLIRPDLVTAVPAHVDVELAGTLTRGMTVCDLRHLRSSDPFRDIAEDASLPARGKAANAEVGLRLDADGFHDLLLSTLRDLP